MDKDLNKNIKSAVGAFTLVLILAAVFIAIKIAGEFNVIEDNDYNTITVEGDSEVFASPDIATVSFSVRKENLDLNKAQAEAEESVSKALNSIKSLGVEDKDIQTTYYNAAPRYEWNQKCGQYGCETGERVLVGYEVSETVSIKIRDLTKVSPIIGALGSSTVTDISGPNFEIENRDELQQQVREEAIKEARIKAKALAKDLDVKLGKIVTFYEGGYGVPVYARAEMDAVMSKEESSGTVSPSIEEGQNRIYSSVSVVYRIK